jgi:hypothetical protein
VTDRNIFNRRYTDFTPGGTQVWLVNGAGVTTSAPSTQTFTAGDNLIQGQVVYVSGTYVLPASAASGVAATQYNAIGITAASAGVTSGVAVNLDDIAVIGSSNLTGEQTLTPGQYYYLSKFTGQLTKFATASGTVSASGGYAALVNLGVALSTTELSIILFRLSLLKHYLFYILLFESNCLYRLQLLFLL